MQTYADIIQCGHLEARSLLEGWKKGDGIIGGVINLAWNVTPMMKYPGWLPVLIYPADNETVYPASWFDPILSFYDVTRNFGKVIVHCQAGGSGSRGCFGILLRARHGKTVPKTLAMTGLSGCHHWRETIEQYGD